MNAPTVTLPADELHPSIVHPPTIRLLTGGELPARHALMRFAPLARSGGVPVPALLAPGADAGKLDPHVAGLLLVGHLRACGEDTLEIVLDGATGRVFTLYLFEDSPGSLEALPLAPSLSALAGFLAETDDFTARRGRFASLSGRTGAAAVAEAERLLSAVFEDADWDGDDWGEAGPRDEWEHALPAYWRIAATVRPLGLIAGPGDGLALALPPGLLDEEFGAADIRRFLPSELPGVLTHEPTRRFLTEVGLPRTELMFGLWGDEDVLRTLTESEAARHDGDGDEDRPVPADAGRLVTLGSLVHDMEAVVDGGTGLLSWRMYGSAGTTPVNADVSTLAFTLWLFGREQRLDREHGFTSDFYEQLAATMVEVLASVDPVACLPAADEEDYRYWPEVFHDEAGGVL
ncbi:SUKH-4 family immunity protein [Streptomyces genisteinicus]|uniref:SUKH-4 family immunity protein n=1 Tax=Streptomyces genisteinicus TaxID=2768068 RepID=A0A7H0HZU3_9ACTN|nr:SUKH-4 family immunity protein [Streptomyces genisteinicus]QNP66059.1 SUKH-4 family immunity protein [Streptomyces genisteinicus]